MNPSAEIGLVTFAANANDPVGLYAKNNYGSLLTALHDISPQGGTNQEDGLIKAKQFWSTASDSEHQRAVILVTDGAPNPGNWNDIAARASELYSQKSATVHTVGLSIENVTGAEAGLVQTARQGGNGQSYSAKNSEELLNDILSIVKLYLKEANLKGTLHDDIDRIFYPVKQDGTPITPGFYRASDDQPLDLTTVQLYNDPSSQSYGTEYYLWKDNGGQWSITWYNLEFGKGTTANPATHKNFYLKAREDFMGGNKIKTNVEEAHAIGSNAVTYNGANKKEQPMEVIIDDMAETPYVNVDELHLTEHSTEWTVYLGTDVTPKDQLRALWDNIKVKQVVKEGGTIPATQTDPADVTRMTGKDQMWYAHSENNNDMNAPANNDADAKLPLSFYGLDSYYDALLAAITNGTSYDSGDIAYAPYEHSTIGNFKVTATKVIDSGAANATANAPDLHTTDKAASPAETYNITVTYTPLTNGADTTYDNTTSGGSAGIVTTGTGNDEVKSENEHIINVYAKTIEVEKRKPADNDTTALLTDKTAGFSLYRKWKLADGDGAKVSLKGYTLDGSVLGKPFSDADYFFLVETQQTNNGIAKFTADLSAAEDPYYLVETQAPEGYQQNKVIQKITVTPGPNTTTTITTPPVTTTTEGAITTAMPYDWTQGVSFYYDDSEIPAVYVDGSGNQIVPITGEESRTYVLPTDAEGWFKTSVLNTPLGYLQVKKIVTYNNDTPTSEELVSLAGIYSFGVYTDQGCEHPYEEDGTQLTLDITISGDAEANSSVISLPVGTYWIKEISEPGSGILPNDNPLDITITEDKTANHPAIVTFTNNKNVDDDKDKLAIELEKQFTGLLDKTHIPEGFKVVLSYKVGTSDRTIDLTNADHGNVGADDVNIDWSESADGFTWHWKITNLPYEASDFRVSEVNYDNATGYDWTGTTLNGENVSDPSQESSQTVLQPTITFQTVNENEINPDNDKTFLFNEDMIWLLRATGHEGVVVISVHTLSYSTRLAVEDYIHTHAFPQAEWGNLAISYYSEEAHPNGFSVHGNKLKLEPLNPPSGNYNYQLTVGKNQSNHNYFYELIYDQHSDANSFKYVNNYQEYPITIDVVKEAINTGEKLSGAVFTLRQIKDAEPGNGGIYTTEDGTTPRDSDPTAETTGLTSFGGLTHGYYELTEKIAPAGYVLTGEAVTYFKIERGVVTWLVKGEGKPSTWVAKISKGAGELVDFEAAVAADTEHDIAAQNATFTVENNPGASLPNTGGPGTNMLYLFGIMLIGLAGTGFVMKRTRRNTA